MTVRVMDAGLGSRLLQRFLEERRADPHKGREGGLVEPHRPRTGGSDGGLALAIPQPEIRSHVYASGLRSLDAKSRLELV